MWQGKHTWFNTVFIIFLYPQPCQKVPKVSAQFSHPSCFCMGSVLVEPPPSGTLPPVQERGERESEQRRRRSLLLPVQTCLPHGSSVSQRHQAVRYTQDQKFEAHRVGGQRIQRNMWKYVQDKCICCSSMSRDNRKCVYSLTHKRMEDEKLTT